MRRLACLVLVLLWAVPVARAKDDPVETAIRAGSAAEVDISGVTTNAEGAQVGYVGCGTIIHPAGYIVTNAHVVGGQNLQAHLEDGRTFPCRVVARHPSEDIAVVKIDADAPLPCLPFGTNAGLRVGDAAIVAGNPNGMTHTVTTGIISRLAPGYLENGHIQTSAAVNGGNSGGPLMNSRGELIGIVTAKGGEAIGLAIPIDRVRRLFPEMLLDEATRGVRLGFTVDMTAEGAVIGEVRAGSPAEVAGLRAEDFVRKVAGVDVRHGLDISLIAGDRKPEEPLSLDVYVDGAAAASRTITITPEPIPLRESDQGADWAYGLRYEAFHGMWTKLPDFDQEKPAAIGWTGAFAITVPGARPEQIGLRFTAWVEVPSDGAWTFLTESDDGSRLWIGDALVVDNDGSHGMIERRGVVRLKAGKHPIRVEWIQGGGAAGLKVSISGPGMDKKEIPATMLFQKTAPK